MKKRSWASSLCFMSVLTFLHVTSGLTVILGHMATIPCKATCSVIEWYEVPAKGEEILVCKFSEGKFQEVAAEFKDRVDMSTGNSSLVITNVQYNDRNWYVCSCDGSKTCDMYVDVLVLTPLVIAVGDKAKLPCYAKTDKFSSNTNVQWDKDEKLVMKVSGGKVEFGEGFKDRVSNISKEDYNRGDLSITIHDVRASDAGCYRCFIQNKASNDPKGINLSIKDASPHWIPRLYIMLVCVIISSCSIIIGVP